MSVYVFLWICTWRMGTCLFICVAICIYLYYITYPCYICIWLYPRRYVCIYDWLVVYLHRVGSTDNISGDEYVHLYMYYIHVCAVLLYVMCIHVHMCIHMQVNVHVLHGLYRCQQLRGCCGVNEFRQCVTLIQLWEKEWPTLLQLQLMSSLCDS